MSRLSQYSNNQIQELSDFYQEVILDHFKNPRFKGQVNDCRFCQSGKNPLCGDSIVVYCKVQPVVLNSNTTCILDSAAKPRDDTSNENQCTLKVHFEGSGCSISQASASIMCELVQNKTVHEVKNITQYAEKVYTGKHKIDPENMTSDLDALHGVGQFPARVKCAALPWKTLECLIAENFDAHGYPITRSCTKHITTLKRDKKLRIVSTETEN